MCACNIIICIRARKLRCRRRRQMINAKMSSSILSKGVKPPRGPRCVLWRWCAGESQSRSSSSIHLARNLSLSRRRRRNGGGKGAFDGGRVEDGRTASVYVQCTDGFERGWNAARAGCHVVFVKQLLYICNMPSPALPCTTSPPPHLPTVLSRYYIILYTPPCVYIYIYA